MADIFISYKRENRLIAEQLASALEQLGFDVWWDFALLSGDQYRKVIREVINQCKAAIVLWSVKAVDSEFVMDEAAHAKAQSKLCPARIDDVELPFGFGQTHTDDLRDWTGEMGHAGFSSLLRAIEAKTGKRARLGARPRDAAGERQFAELEAFKAAQLSGNDEALRAFIRQHPGSAFSAFVRSQLGEGPAPGSSQGARPSEPASFASTASVRPREKEKGSPWPIIALLAILVAGGAAGFTVWQGSNFRTATADPASETAAPAEPAVNVDAAVESARMEERNKADDLAYAQAQSSDTSAAYDAYLAAWPSGRNADAARSSRSTAADRERDAASAAANAAASQEAARDRIAKDAADDAAYAIARGTNTSAAYDTYLRDYPYGRNASAARSAKNSLAVAAAPPVYAAYDINQLLNSSVRTAVENARAAKAKAEIAATRARNIAASATPVTYSNGQSYAGDTRGSGNPGFGVFNFASNDANKALRYEGEFDGKGLMNGYGVYYWSTGEKFYGTFANNSTNGPGVRDLTNGHRWEGEEVSWHHTGFNVLWDSNGKLMGAGIATNDVITTSLLR